MQFSVIFAGTPDFAVPTLEALIKDPAYDVTLVITQPDKPIGRGKDITPPPVKKIAETNGIPVIQPEDINTSDITSQERPDFLVVVAYGQILKKPILNWPKVAAVNVHASLLPRWRGASPIQHAILEGDSESGVTLQKIEEKLDSGPIIGQYTTVLHPCETAETLHDRLSQIGAELVVEKLKEPIGLKEQDKNKVTVCQKFSREDGDVDPETMTAREIDRCVRALNPWPGVLTKIDGKEVKLIQAGLAEKEGSFPLSCAAGSTLYVYRLQPPGKRSMLGEEWARGHK